MLVPAVLYKNEIEELCMKNYYTDAMLFETGTLDNWFPHIHEQPSANQFQFASVNKEGELLGFFCYTVDWYADVAYNFGMMSQQTANAAFAKDIFDKMEELVSRHHRVEWRMVGGNPVEKSYDRFIERHNGKKYVFKDRIRDKEGCFRNDIMYEVVR